MSNIRSFQGKNPQIADDAWVDETAVVIGEVTIGGRSSVWPLCVIRGDIHRIEIGAQTNIQDGSVLHVSHDSRFMPGGAPLIIHDRVTVGHQVVLHGCEIRDLCLVGIGSRVLDRAVLEPHTMLGAKQPGDGSAGLNGLDDPDKRLIDHGGRPTGLPDDRVPYGHILHLLIPSRTLPVVGR